MKCSRRDLLKFSAGAAAVWATGTTLRADEAKSDKKIPIGVQLYSVRDVCGKDVPGTLQAIAKMGYQGVDFAGYYGRSAKDLRKMLDDAGLIACGTHTGLDSISEKNLKNTVEFNQTLGNKYLIVPGGVNGKTADDIIKIAKRFNEAAEKVKADGMQVGYHAHGGDFKKIDGETIWDIFFSHTNPEVVMQLDIGNSMGGGADPVAILKKFPGRATTVHLKEHGGPKGAAIGEGNAPWKEVFQLCETIGGTKWYIVEQEAYQGSSMDSIKKCVDNLRKMGK